MLQIGVQERSLRAKICYWLHRISALELRLFNCNTIGALMPTEA